MPKMKTRKSIVKRFRKTASGKFKRPHGNKRHLLTGRTSKRKRQLRKAGYSTPAEEKMLRQLLPYA